MNWFYKLFAKKLIISSKDNNSVFMLEIDMNKHYIFFINPGSLTKQNEKVLKALNPKKITLVYCY